METAGGLEPIDTLRRTYRATVRDAA
jgi:hypothetical protein